jgi:hypothetical protein
MAIKLDSNRLGESASSEHQPLLGFLETQRQLEPGYTVIRDRYGLSLKEAAESAAAASAFLIQKTSQVLDPNIAFELAVYGFIEGTKTVPHSIVAE